MREAQDTAHRLAAYSDAVFAVIVTIMVLELKAPEEASFAALWPLWPTVISYAVGYLFIAIIWINHHHLMRFVAAPTLRLMWTNFIERLRCVDDRARDKTPTRGCFGTTRRSSARRCRCARTTPRDRSRHRLRADAASASQ